MQAIGYGRVSTQEQAREGVSLDAQRHACQAEAERRGLDFLWLADEGVSGGVAPENRPRLKAALALLDAGEASALLFTRIDRASRKTEDFAGLLRLADQRGWQVIVIEMGIDTRTPLGKAMAHMAAVFAELERDNIRSRTREGLAERRRQGVRLGRPRNVPDDVLARIRREAIEGRTPYAIAAGLSADGVPTAQGADRWSPQTVKKLLDRANKEIPS